MTPVDKTVTTCQGVNIFEILFLHQIPNKKNIKSHKISRQKNTNWLSYDKKTTSLVDSTPPPDTNRVKLHKKNQ